MPYTVVWIDKTCPLLIPLLSRFSSCFTDNALSIERGLHINNKTGIIYSCWYYSRTQFNVVTPSRPCERASLISSSSYIPDVNRTGCMLAMVNPPSSPHSSDCNHAASIRHDQAAAGVINSLHCRSLLLAYLQQRGAGPVPHFLICYAHSATCIFNPDLPISTSKL